MPAINKTFSRGVNLDGSMPRRSTIPRPECKTFPGNKDTFAEIFQYATEFGGYYGSETKQLVAWAVENARGTPSTFKEYLQSSQFTLK